MNYLISKTTNINATISLTAGAGLQEKFASLELQKYFKKMSGNLIPIETWSDNNDGIKIMIIDASRPSNSKFLTGLPIHKLKDDGYLIYTKEDKVIITSKDHFGIVFGTYQYLSKVFGISFIDMGESGEDFPSLDVLEHDDLNIFKNPRLYYRGTQFCYRPKKIDWMAKNGFNYARIGCDNTLEFWDQKLNELGLEYQKRGIKVNFGHHAFNLYLSFHKYKIQNPEYFLQEDGKPVAKGQFSWDTSNFEALDEAIYNIKDFLRKHPEIAIFDFWPEDGEREISEKEFEGISGEKFNLDEKWKENVVNASPTARMGNPYKAKVYSLLTKRLAEALIHEFPNVQVMMTGYGDLSQPCQNTKLPKNVTSTIALYWRCVKHTIHDESCIYNSQYWKILKEWLALYKNRKICVSEYYMGIHSHSNLPFPLVKTIFNEWEQLIELGIQGAKVNTSREDDTTSVYHMNYLAFQSIVWSEHKDAESFIKDYCQKFFMKAGEKMFKMYQSWEDEVQKSDHALPGIHHFHLMLGKECLQKSKQIIYEAMESEDDPKVTHRLSNVLIQVNYALKTLSFSKALYRQECLTPSEPIKKETVFEMKEMISYVKRMIELDLDIFGIQKPSKYMKTEDLKNKATRWEREYAKLVKLDWVKKDFDLDIIRKR